MLISKRFENWRSPCGSFSNLQQAQLLSSRTSSTYRLDLTIRESFLSPYFLLWNRLWVLTHILAFHSLKTFSSLRYPLSNRQYWPVSLQSSHTRFPGLDRNFWESSPASTVWNILASKPGKTTLSRLRSLSLERAGITDYQLARVLESKPMLAELRLHKCLTLTNKTFKSLAESNVGQHIETLCFTKNEKIDDRILEHIGKLPNLKVQLSLMKGIKVVCTDHVSQVLSLHGCENVHSGLMTKLNNEQWHIRDLTLPSTPSSPKRNVEIDPEYLRWRVLSLHAHTLSEVLISALVGEIMAPCKRPDAWQVTYLDLVSMTFWARTFTCHIQQRKVSLAINLCVIARITTMFLSLIHHPRWNNQRTPPRRALVSASLGALGWRSFFL